MSNKSPAFQWYPKDILASARVQMMSLAEECAYRRLIDFCWIHGSIPADPNKAARLVGKGCSVEVAKVALEMFTVNADDESQLIHDRLEEERVKQAQNSEKRRQASEVRWSKQGKSANERGKQVNTKPDANAMQTQTKPDTNLSPQSEISSTKTVKNDKLEVEATISDSITTELEANGIRLESKRNANAMQMQCTSSSTSSAKNTHPKSLSQKNGEVVRVPFGKFRDEIEDWWCQLQNIVNLPPDQQTAAALTWLYENNFTPAEIRKFYEFATTDPEQKSWRKGDVNLGTIVKGIASWRAKKAEESSPDTPKPSSAIELCKLCDDRGLVQILVEGAKRMTKCGHKK